MARLSSLLLLAATLLIKSVNGACDNYGIENGSNCTCKGLYISKVMILIHFKALLASLDLSASFLRVVELCTKARRAQRYNHRTELSTETRLAVLVQTAGQA